MKSLLSKIKWYVGCTAAGILMVLALLVRSRKSTSKPTVPTSFDPRTIQPEPVPTTRAERIEYLRKEGLVK